MQRYQVQPGSKVRLRDWDPNDTAAAAGDKSEAKERLEKLNQQLEDLQERLYAESKHKLLVVLQGMDTSGKDGTIRHVFEGVNPQGVQVASFKVPTPIELAHDFLWRVHARVPGRGEIVIFNRSHYEDVLVVRVHNLVAAEIWNARYQQINDFERLLVESGTTVLKFFLHIDRKQQKDRLEARLRDPKKQWKFNRGDLKERERWNDYIEAYEQAIERTSTSWAPWTIVPANKKWYRNLVVATVLVETLEALRPRYPEPQESLDDVVVS